MKKALICIFAITLLWGCTSTRQLQKQSAHKSSYEILVDSVRKAEPLFDFATVKMNVNINYNGTSFSSSALCKIRRDSAMHISFQPVFGVEMFKMEVTPDKILIFDKLNQRYYETDFSFIGNKLGEGMNFKNFQALISNRYFSMLSDSVANNCTVSSGNIVCENQTLKQETFVNQKYRIEHVALQYPAKNRILETLYSEFTLADGILFPAKINLEASQPGSKIKVTFNCTKLNFSTSPVFNASSVSQYVKSDIKQLLSK